MVADCITAGKSAEDVGVAGTSPRSSAQQYWVIGPEGSQQIQFYPYKFQKWYPTNFQRRPHTGPSTETGGAHPTPYTRQRSTAGGGAPRSLSIHAHKVLPARASWTTHDSGTAPYTLAWLLTHGPASTTASDDDHNRAAGSGARLSCSDPRGGLALTHLFHQPRFDAILGAPLHS